MPVTVYLDETGDHSLEREDEDFPIFALVLLICDTARYCDQIVPAFYRLKMDYWGHEGIILHSRDIRKAKGDFAFLQVPNNRQPFYERINDLMGGLEYTLVAAVIRKQSHKSKYGTYAQNPYDLSVELAMERLVPLLESFGQTKVSLIAESRGRDADRALELKFQSVVTHGTGYNNMDRFRSIAFDLVFRPKAMNIISTQMADLAGYPIARHVLDSSKPNPAYQIVKGKLYAGTGGVRGLKVFP